MYAKNIIKRYFEIQINFNILNKKCKDDLISLYI